MSRLAIALLQEVELTEGFLVTLVLFHCTHLHRDVATLCRTNALFPTSGFHNACFSEPEQH